MNKTTSGIFTLCVALVCGSFFLAMRNVELQALFLDLAKIATSGYIGYSMRGGADA
ncbi:hypothetical protein Glo7428_3757 [Gloeocapsa sp. PCC 7428]|jgi:hypothetical protein|uniref:hypothetical protein n=1 Tax=Gloeocapsa sp. PCC 7428 TaxID=1173026 RepID=UPI0002A61D39|nr:hypothetical protein [Gloeocapsa sp. PCC 7428]AFZ32217.1 hypothetical protein Glo7428_3757 [Gloeocapsa sp. PCC 7428]